VERKEELSRGSHAVANYGRQGWGTQRVDDGPWARRRSEEMQVPPLRRRSAGSGRDDKVEREIFANIAVLRLRRTKAARFRSG